MQRWNTHPLHAIVVGSLCCERGAIRSIVTARSRCRTKRKNRRRVVKRAIRFALGQFSSHMDCSPLCECVLRMVEREMES